MSTYKIAFAVGIVMALSGGIVSGQFQPTTPSWYGASATSLNPAISHAGLQGVPLRTRKLLTSENRQTLWVGNVGFAFSQFRSDLVMISGGDTVAPLAILGHYATGLSYTLDVAPHYVHQNGGLVVAGVIVVGVLSNTRSRILYAPITPGQDFTALSFQSLVPDSSPGAVWMVGGAVGSKAYVFEGVSGKIYEYLDSDDNGRADSPSGAMPFDIDTLDSPIPPHGFHYKSENQVAVQMSPGPEILWTLENQSGVLVLESKIAEWWDRVRPSLSSQPRAKQQLLRVFYRPGRTVQVFVGEGGSRVPISLPTSVSDPMSRYVDVKISKKIQHGDIVSIDDVADPTKTSMNYTAEGERHAAFSGGRDDFFESEVIQIIGDGFKKDTTTLNVKFKEGGIVSNPSWKYVSRNLIILTAPNLQMGVPDADRLEVTITDSRFLGGGILKFYHVVKKP